MKKKRKKVKYTWDVRENPLDERQKTLSRKILNDALLIFALLVLINAFVWDKLAWSESIMSTTLLFGGVCALYDRIRCAAAGCLFGVRGAEFQLFPTVTLIFSSGLGIYNALRFGSVFTPFSVIRNGLVMWEFQMLICWTLMLISSLITLFFIIREKRAKKCETDNSEKE